jgi:ABC-type nitrate/sulfonate/bicarbonate transport system ATPase subunit
LAPVTEASTAAGGLEIEVALKRYPAVGDAVPHTALRDLRFSVRHGEFVCLLGPSGCGKTTLLNIIAGLDRDFEGSLNLPRVPGRERPRIGYVFQNPRLLPWRTLIENIELVLTPEQCASGLVDELLEVADLAGFRDSYPARLSLGMSRRAALVRAFAVQPDLLLMDEPFVSLDPARAQRLRRLLVRIWSERPTTVLFVTHDVSEAIALADRIILLSAPPSHVVADVAVTLDRDRRWERDELEAARAALMRDVPALAAMG